jgi:hypothetical protein
MGLLGREELKKYPNDKKIEENDRNRVKIKDWKNTQKSERGVWNT